MGDQWMQLATIPGLIPQAGYPIGLEPFYLMHYPMVRLSSPFSSCGVAQNICFAQYHKASHPE